MKRFILPLALIACTPKTAQEQPQRPANDIVADIVKAHRKELEVCGQPPGKIVFTVKRLRKRKYRATEIVGAEGACKERVAAWAFSKSTNGGTYTINWPL